MAKARANREARICEECGRPIESGRAHQFLCRSCQQALERRRRRGEGVRQNRRSSLRDLESDDW